MDDKLFDVAKPGQSAAAPSSRPIIVDRTPLPVDPMVAGTKAAAPTLSTARTTITPPDSLTKATTEPAVTKDTAAMPVTPAEEKDQKAKQAAKEAEEQKARLQEVQKLASSRKYVVPIGETHHSNIMRHLLLAVLAGVTIVIVILYLAVDAGFIKTSIKLPIDLIQNNK